MTGKQKEPTDEQYRFVEQCPICGERFLTIIGGDEDNGGEPAWKHRILAHGEPQPRQREIKVKITWKHTNQAMVEGLKLLGLYEQIDQREGWLVFIEGRIEDVCSTIAR